MNQGTDRLVRSAPDMDERPDDRPDDDRPGSRSADAAGPGVQGGVQGADSVWSMISLLVAGPVAWAGIGWLADRAAGTSVFVPLGVVLGFVGSLYLVYMKYGRT